MITEKFNLYDFIGYFLPGVVAVYGLSIIFPETNFLFQKNQITIGEFGIFAVVSYTTGHLIQALSNILTKIWWIKGKPTDWILKKDDGILNNYQKIKIKNIIIKLGIYDDFSYGKISKSEWNNIITQIRSYCAIEPATNRFEIFNANYGLYKGLTMSLIILLIAYWTKYGFNNLIISISLIILILAAFYRMHRFAVYYAKELFMIVLHKSNKS